MTVGARRTQPNVDALVDWHGRCAAHAGAVWMENAQPVTLGEAVFSDMHIAVGEHGPADEDDVVVGGG